MTLSAIKCDLHGLHMSQHVPQKNHTTAKPGITDQALQIAENKLRLM